MLLRRLLASRASFHLTSRLLAEHVVKVPSMGDSISEGTVVQIKKRIGEHVHVDEVVMVLETDKVSVDVMSPTAGTLVKSFVELDQDVVVGHDLFVVDGDVSPASPSADTASVTPGATSPKTVVPSHPVKHPAHHVRIPRIKFLGKRSLLVHHNNITSKKAAIAPSDSAAAKSPRTAPSSLLPPSSSHAHVFPFHEVPVRFARKHISKEEVASINTATSFL